MYETDTRELKKKGSVMFGHIVINYIQNQKIIGQMRVQRGTWGANFTSVIYLTTYCKM